jgi:hypothetical protein
MMRQREEVFELAFYDLAKDFAASAVETLAKVCANPGLMLPAL